MPDRIKGSGIWDALCFIKGNGKKKSIAHIINNGTTAFCGEKSDESYFDNLIVAEETLPMEDVILCNDCRISFIKKEIGYKEKIQPKIKAV